ncbi:MAG: transglutaminase domain-containing protein [Ktedonobacterales bacterium]
MDPIAYYTSQSAMTDPGAFAALYDDLPAGAEALARVVQGLVIHYRSADFFDHTIPEDRLCEIDTRDVAAILARIAALDGRPLAEPRPPERRFVGCCRDFATLFCSMARSRGIPTRTRVGFATYFEPHFNVDHVIVEYYDAAASRWHLLDPEISARHLERGAFDFDPHAVPRDRFIVAGLAWQRVRSGARDPDTYGVAPGSELRGARFIRHKLVQDLAAQNKVELLLWDIWGLMLSVDLTKDELALLDRVATVTQAGPEALGTAQALYTANESLAVPARVLSFSLVGVPAVVTLAILP